MDKIAVLDYGSQYTKLIARRIRDACVYSEIFPPGMPTTVLRDQGFKGIVLSGGPSSVYDPGAPIPPNELFDLGVPILGICYGMQAMARVLGGDVEASNRREYGRADLKLLQTSGLFHGLQAEGPGPSVRVWMSHGDTVKKAPPGFQVIGTTANTPVAAMADEGLRLYGVHFHPEVAHTPQGTTIIENFIFRICRCEPTWSMESFIDSTVEVIRTQVGGERVLCALSGGVDSSVVAVLVHRAIGDRLTCIFVDNGLLRAGEAESVDRTFMDHFHMNLVHADARSRFLARLDGVFDPEEKRKIIGNEFIAVFEEEAAKLGTIPFLAQGTLYPDVIESVSLKGPSSTIKTHHNVGGLPTKMSFQLVEPLRELFKDEVRRVGELLGLPEEIVWRQPFPGPGLAIRILGEVTEESLQIVRGADTIVQEEIRRAGLYKELWQAFAVLLPVRTVGVMGDFRTYAQVVAIRAVNSLDGMTADWARLPHDLLSTMANRIINEVGGVNRVVFDISSKPPSTIEWE